ncbi:MAG: four helix bundle protein [Bdellovibrionota bacterium]
MLENFVAFGLAKELYKSCKRVRLPRNLYEQLQRASASVALNLAEGSGKRTAPEQKRFYGIALGSLRECEAILALEDVGDAKLKEQLN